MCSTQFPVSYLKAVSNFAAKGDVRYYINVVHLEIHPDMTIIVATDGVSLGSIAHETQNDVSEIVKVSIPIDVVKGVKVKKSEMKQNVEVVKVDDENWNLIFGGVSFEFNPLLCGTFPNWKRVFPSDVSGESADLSVTEIEKFQKATKDLNAFSKSGQPLTKFHQNGSNDSTVVAIGHTPFAGLIMPMSKMDEYAIPAWIERIK